MNKSSGKRFGDIVSRIKYLNELNGIKDLHEVVTPQRGLFNPASADMVTRSQTLDGKYSLKIYQKIVNKMMLNKDPYFYKVRQDDHGLVFRTSGSAMGLRMVNYNNKPLLVIRAYNFNGIWALRKYINSITVTHPFDISRFLNR